MIGLLVASVAAAVLALAALRAVGAPILSPGVVGVAFYVLVGGFGAIAAATSSFDDSGAAHYVLDYTVHSDTMLIFAGVACAFGAGAALAQLVLRQRCLELPDFSEMRQSLAGAVPGRGVVAVAVIPLVVEILGLGGALFHASQYLQADGPSWAFKLGGTLAPIGFLAAAYLGAVPGQGRQRLGKVLCLAYAVVLFSTATRALGLLPLLWLLTVEGLGVGGTTTRRVLRAGWVFALMYLALGSALTGRGLADHGLLAYASHFAHDPSSLIQSATTIGGNLLFGYPLTSFVVHVAPQVTQHDISTSLNPLPGSMTDWTTIAPTLRAHPYIPYSTLGELFSFSPAFGLVYFGIAGFVFQYAGAALLSKSSLRIRLAVALTVLATAAFFMVTTLEYNTRSVTRTLWLLLLLVIVSEATHLVQVVRRRATWRPTFSATL